MRRGAKARYPSASFERLPCHPFPYQQRRDFILNAGPDFVHVKGWLRRAPAIWPACDEETRIVVGGKFPWRLLEVPKIVAPVVPEDCRNRLFHLLFWQDVSQVQLMRPPLADQLIGKTSGSKLILRVCSEIHLLNVI